jgi:hypothetical protein
MINSTEAAAFAFMLRAAQRDARRLQSIEQRLFASELDIVRIEALDEDDLLSDRIEAFASRFGRLQDLIGDKLLARLARLLEEEPGSRLELLDRAERLGWILSADRWLAARRLRNNLTHEYFETAAELLEALHAVRRFVPDLIDSIQRIQSKAAALGISETSVQKPTRKQ